MHDNRQIAGILQVGDLLQGGRTRDIDPGSAKQSGAPRAGTDDHAVRFDVAVRRADPDRSPLLGERGHPHTAADLLTQAVKRGKCLVGRDNRGLGLKQYWPGRGHAGEAFCRLLNGQQFTAGALGPHGLVHLVHLRAERQLRHRMQQALAGRGLKLGPQSPGALGETHVLGVLVAEPEDPARTL